MKILITGAAGMVGNAFISFLQNKNIETVAIFNNQTVENKAANVKYICLNLLDAESTKCIIATEKPTHILHLAAQSSVGLSWQIPATTINHNTTTFTNLLEAVKEAKIDCKTLLVSSAEVYAYSNVPVCETHKVQPHNAYALSRIMQESIANFYSKNYHLPITIARSFNHISALQNNNFVIPTFINQIIEHVNKGNKNISLQVGNIHVVRDFLDVNDICIAYWQLLNIQNPKPIYNVCSSIGTSLVEVLKYLEEIAGIQIETHIDNDKLRKNDNLYLVGNNKLLKSDTIWQQTISIKQSLAYIYNTKLETYSIK